MAYSYYIYYRVTREKAAACEVRVLELISALKERTGVSGRLLKKRSEPLLWMEVYENVRDDAKFELELKQAATELKAAECLQEGSGGASSASKRRVVLMCLILFALEAHPSYPLIVAANRDEAYSRTTAQAAFWEEHAHVYGGRDLEQGGTWLSVTRDGRFAAVTNYRQGVRSTGVERSRGALTRDFLTGSEAPAAYLRGVETHAADYNGFSLIVGESTEMWFYSNRGAAAQKIAPGVHGLSNHLLDEPWPKVRRGVAELRSLLGADENELITRLFTLLADRAPAPDEFLPATGVTRDRERALSASFIEGETYGTRASTVVLVGSDGQALVRERSFGPGGATHGEAEQRFVLDRGVTRVPPVRARA